MKRDMPNRFLAAVTALVAVAALGYAMLPGEAAAPGGETTPATRAATPTTAGGKINVLVIAGGHGFDKKAFGGLFEGVADFSCTFLEEKDKQGGEAYEDISNWSYDVILLYNYQKDLSEKRRENFLKLMDKGVGLVILHHAIYGYRPWPEFKNIVGVTSWLSGSKDNVEFKVHVEDPNHPITRGIADFTINDETYKGYTLDPNVRVLLTTEEPTNAKSIAWVHTYRKSPVCYVQLGHGPKAFAVKEFRTVMERAVRWTAGRLKEQGRPAAK